MYLSNINSKITYKSTSLQERYLQSLLAIYKAHLVRVKTQQSPRQICPPRRFCCRLSTVIYLESSWYVLRHGGEIICEITDRRRRSDVDGKGLEVSCVIHFLGRAKKLLKLLLVKETTNS